MFACLVLDYSSRYPFHFIQRIPAAIYAFCKVNNYIIEGSDKSWCFFDWKEGLDKQASAHAIYIYILNAAIELAEILEEKKLAKQLQEEKGYCSSEA